MCNCRTNIEFLFSDMIRPSDEQHTQRVVKKSDILLWTLLISATKFRTIRYWEVDENIRDKLVLNLTLNLQENVD